MDIFFKTLELEVITQKVAYNFWSLMGKLFVFWFNNCCVTILLTVAIHVLADVGGTMGLWLGITILCVFEALSYALDGCVQTVRNLIKKGFPSDSH